MTRLEYLSLSAMIDMATTRFGTSRVLVAAVTAALRARPRPPELADLSDHIRRDMGLPPAEPSRSYTEHMR